MKKETTEKVRELLVLKDQLRKTIKDPKNPDKRFVLECI